LTALINLFAFSVAATALQGDNNKVCCLVYTATESELIVVLCSGSTTALGQFVCSNRVFWLAFSHRFQVFRHPYHSVLGYENDRRF